MNIAARLNCINCNVSIQHATFEKHEGLCAICYKVKKKEDEVKQVLSIPGCPGCDGRKYLSFNRKKLTPDENYKLNDYIIPVKNLKYGILYKCKNCNINWWLDIKTDMMYLITQQRAILIEQWNIKRPALTVKNLMQLVRIKKTSLGMYENKYRHHIFPCSMITKNNIYHAKSLIHITDLPPLYENSEFVLFADEVQTILPSFYALPLSVRKATAVAQEIRMNFSPTLVQSSSGRKFVLNGVHQFFDYQGIKGEDIMLLGKVGNLRGIALEYYPDNEKNVYHIYVDLNCALKFLLNLLL